MADDDVDKCAHDVCRCAVAEGSEYCSAYCESAGEAEITEMRCDCGHPECA